MHLTNFACFTEPKTTLFREEIDAIASIVTETIQMDGFHNKGSFLLMGQADGRAAQTLIRFDFEDGAVKNYNLKGHSSAAEAKRVLEFGARANKADSHISYFIDTELFLTLNTTSGRFLCACYGENAGYGFQRKVYIAVATAIAYMGKEDTVLQSSMQRLLQNDSGRNIVQTSDYVREMFEAMALPELKAWHEWHEPANNAGNLTLFFE